MAAASTVAVASLYVAGVAVRFWIGILTLLDIVLLLAVCTK